MLSKNHEKVNNFTITIELLLSCIKQVKNLKSKLIDKAKNGIEELTTSLIIAELGDISRFNNIKQLTTYCGLVPFIKQSGSSINIRGPISKSGNRCISRILFVTIQNIIPIASKNFTDNNILLYYKKNVTKVNIITLL